MITVGNDTPRPAPVDPAAAAAEKKRWQVRWTAQSREHHSAPMNEAEAQKFAARLRTEKAEDVIIEEAPERRLSVFPHIE